MVSDNKAADKNEARGKSGRGRGRPRPEDAAVIEDHLLAIALQEFLQHGYGQASMARIIDVAGVSKTTLYSRYPAKDLLFRAIMQQQIDNLTPSAALHAGSAPPNLAQGLKAYANHMLELSLRGDLLGVNRLLYSESHRFPELGAAAAERSEMGVQRISRFIEACAAVDGFSCRDARSVAEIFILSIRGWYINLMLTNREVTAPERKAWVNQLVHVLVSGREHW